jgi:hypothetical protein
MRTRIAGGLFVSHLRSETDLKSHNLKTYLLQGIGFFFMRKTKPALMTTTPIADSLINYAQLLQIKKH